MVSRAYMKAREAVDWLALPIKPGQRCVDVGCAPGGSSQALLDCGLRVTGVDPANVDPRVARHPQFRHVRKRGGDLKRKEYGEFQWLFADMNVAPAFTLAMVRDIVTYRSVNMRGVVLTIKLPDWNLAAEVPDYVSEVRAWGYPVVRARQLSWNRQEICLAGLRPARPSQRTRRRSRKLPFPAVTDSSGTANRT
jgi:23S rRNA (cytidine2498-2'-O)-methyltransferase